MNVFRCLLASIEETGVEIDPELQSLLLFIRGIMFVGVIGKVSNQVAVLETAMNTRDVARTGDAMGRVVLAVNRPGLDVVDGLSWRSCLSRQRRLCQNHGKERYDRAKVAPCNLPGSTVQEPYEQLSSRRHSERKK